MHSDFVFVRDDCGRVPTSAAWLFPGVQGHHQAGALPFLTPDLLELKTLKGVLLLWCCLMCPVHGSLHWMGITCAPPTFAPNAAHSKSGGLAGRPPASWRTPGCSICSSPTPPSRPSWHSPFLLPAHAGRLGLPDSALPASPLHRPPPHWSRLLLACHHCPSLHWGGCLPAPERHTRSTFPGVIPLQLLFINAH